MKSETLTEFAERMAKEAKDEANRIFSNALTSDGWATAQVMERLTRKELEAKRWAELV